MIVLCFSLASCESTMKLHVSTEFGKVLTFQTLWNIETHSVLRPHVFVRTIAITF